MSKTETLNETRTFAKITNRSVDPENNTVTIDGYATVYDVRYPIAGGSTEGGFDEQISRGATAKSLQERDDVRLLINHDGVPLARTKSGTLKLESDEIGLRCQAILDQSNPRVTELLSAMDRGDIDGMSFAFQVTRDKWTENYTKRDITEVKLLDVSIVTYPANDATLVKARSAAQATLETKLSTPVLDELRTKFAEVKK